MSELHVKNIIAQIEAGAEEILVGRQQVLDAGDMRDIARALKDNKTVRLIAYGQNEIGDDGLIELVKALPYCNVTQLNVFLCGIGARGAAALAEILPKSKITHLMIHGNPLGDAGINSLAAALPQSSLIYMNVNECEMGQEGLKNLAKAVGRSRTIRSLSTSYNPATDVIGEGYGFVLQALMRHPSMVSWDFRNKPGTAQSVANPSVEQEFAGQESLLVMHGPPNMSGFICFTQTDAAAWMAHRNFQEVEKLLPEMQVTSPSDMPLLLRAQIEARRHLVRIQSRNTPAAGAYESYDTFRKLLPEPPEGELPSLAHLFEPKRVLPGLKPRCLLESHKTWERHPNLLEVLFARGDVVTKEDLVQVRGAQGHSLLEYAIAFGDVEQIMTTLNDRGIRLGAKELLNENGSAGFILECVLAKNQTLTLFKKNNWLGAQKSELAKVVRNLPAGLAATIPNFHTLTAHLSRNHSVKEL